MKNPLPFLNGEASLFGGPSPCSTRSRHGKHASTSLGFLIQNPNLPINIQKLIVQDSSFSYCICSPLIQGYTHFTTLFTKSSNRFKSATLMIPFELIVQFQKYYLLPYTVMVHYHVIYGIVLNLLGHGRPIIRSIDRCLQTVFGIGREYRIPKSA